jgi:hypothetical protein
MRVAAFNGGVNFLMIDSSRQRKPSTASAAGVYVMPVKNG